MGVAHVLQGLPRERGAAAAGAMEKHRLIPLQGRIVGRRVWVGAPFLVKRRARLRLAQIDYEVPELVDLLVTTVEARGQPLVLEALTNDQQAPPGATSATRLTRGVPSFARWRRLPSRRRCCGWRPRARPMLPPPAPRPPPSQRRRSAKGGAVGCDACYRYFASSATASWLALTPSSSARSSRTSRRRCST